MNLVIDTELITYLENLSYLTLPDDEKKGLESDLNGIVNFLAKLNELDTSGVEERSHPFDEVNNFRDDEVLPSFVREKILQNAPHKTEEMLIVPKTVGDELE
ncbi:MAG: Asp-tRNA(Asn)/Glu-tRNA(Gln) amidotransferase subunit GatC [Defluviitaleaceae bacterium]|nr:Asp-tRNA(Asn)/Glu-tRNA(Gln) amidotransferase subunit GatC [Defluviitaleaceae bacterium]